MPDKRIVLKIMQIPQGYDDPADLFHRAQNAGALWESAIGNAKVSTSWMIESLDTRFDLDSPVGKSEAVTEMLSALLHLPPIERGYHVHELAQHVDAHEDDVREHLNELYLQIEPHVAEPKPKIKPIVLDKFGEARDFPCPLCGYDRTHYSQPMQVWTCFNCEQTGRARDAAMLERNVRFAAKRRENYVPQRDRRHGPASFKIP